MRFFVAVRFLVPGVCRSEGPGVAMTSCGKAMTSRGTAPDGAERPEALQPRDTPLPPGTGFHPSHLSHRETGGTMRGNNPNRPVSPTTSYPWFTTNLPHRDQPASSRGSVLVNDGALYELPLSPHAVGTRLL